MIPIDPSEITPERVYLSRRRFIRAFGGVTLAQLVLGACRTRGVGVGVVPAERATDAAASTTGGLGAGTTPEPGATVAADELGDPLTDFADVSGYTNYYEFSIDKDGPARLARGLVTTPWAVAVGGMVARPGTFDVADLGRRFGIEERVYRMRCVEGWSMVIPWLGFPLRRLLDLVEPASGARYVRFESILDPDRFPGQRDGLLPWPYVEGLRLDEARHDLVLLATGLYGRDLPPQNGAPIRLVVPWKYGFKSIKAIVKIDLVADRPTSTWMASAPDEYGFFANVNPEVDHPRWSQATERRIGELLRRRTLKFNGYADEVAQLYAGMDLRADF